MILKKVSEKHYQIRKYAKDIPIIAGSTKDEVKLWLASARYFVDLDYSILGTIF